MRPIEKLFIIQLLTTNVDERSNIQSLKKIYKKAFINSILKTPERLEELLKKWLLFCNKNIN